ncbi:MAG: HlyD family efflux transporter periplasmic adaptor subunit [Defluviitaleaceae bacterium]|nr:HlyD family efflux transporter periplasmic adaptor subunit [Defluviitaleaceae bacterium]
MKKPIKYAVIAIVVLASIAGGVFYALQPTPVRMTEVRRQVAELSFTEQGVVVAENTMLVFAGAQGELSELYVSEGQEISAGDAILRVDTTALALQLSQVQSGIRGLEAQLANVDVEDANARRTLETTRTSLQGELLAINAQAAEAHRGFASHQESLDEQLRVQQILIDQHENGLVQASENFSRIGILYAAGVVPRVEYEAAQTAVLAAESAIEAARGQLAIIAAGTAEAGAEHFEGMRASLEAQIEGISRQLAADNTASARANFEALIAVENANIARLEHELQNAVATAPISGVITTLHAQNTNFITAAAPIAEITVPSGQLIEVYVSTQDVSSIVEGDTVGLTLRQRAGDVYFSGSIAEIGNTAVARFTALGVEERKVNVRILPDDLPDANFGIGYGMDVTFYIYRAENMLTVPRTAIFRRDGEYMVWVVPGGDGEAEARAVQTGMELRTETVITNGLSEGEFVINDANNRDISAGARVRAE